MAVIRPTVQFSFHPKQKSIASAILNTPASVTKYHVLRASRQCGKTHLIERLSLPLAFERGGQEGAFIMATNSQCRKVHRSMIKWLPAVLVKSTNNTDGARSIEFVNGTILMFFSSGSYDSVAGNSFDFMICDEFALWNPNAWGIIRPTLNAKPMAKVVIASTPRGKNDFYKMCMEGMDGTDSFVVHYQMSYLDAVLPDGTVLYDKREIESAKKMLSSELFNQELLAEFIDGISNVFGSFAKVQKLKKYPSYCSSHQYSFAIDCSGEGADKTILTIIDNDTRKVAQIYEVVATDPAQQIEELTRVIKGYSRIRGYVEDNGLGVTFLSYLDTRGIDVTRWHTTQDSKQILVSGLIMAISESTLELPTDRLCPELDEQMTEFMGSRSKNGKISYSHPIGKHDDYVDSLMMALHAVDTLIDAYVQEEIEYEEYY